MFFFGVHVQNWLGQGRSWGHTDIHICYKSNYVSSFGALQPWKSCKKRPVVSGLLQVFAGQGDFRLRYPLSAGGSAGEDPSSRAGDLTQMAWIKSRWMMISWLQMGKMMKAHGHATCCNNHPEAIFIIFHVDRNLKKHNMGQLDQDGVMATGQVGNLVHSSHPTGAKLGDPERWTISSSSQGCPLALCCLDEARGRQELVRIVTLLWPDPHRSLIWSWKTVLFCEAELVGQESSCFFYP